MAKKKAVSFAGGQEQASGLLSASPRRRQRAQVEFLLSMAAAAGLCTPQEAERWCQDCRPETALDDRRLGRPGGGK